MGIALSDLLDPQFFGLLKLNTQLLGTVGTFFQAVQLDDVTVAEMTGGTVYKGRVAVEASAAADGLLSLLDIPGLSLGSEQPWTLILTVQHSRFLSTKIDEVAASYPYMDHYIQPLFDKFSDFTYPSLAFTLELQFGTISLSLPDEFVPATLDGAWLKAIESEQPAKVKLSGLSLFLGQKADLTPLPPNLKPTNDAETALTEQYFLHKSKTFGFGFDQKNTSLSTAAPHAPSAIGATKDEAVKGLSVPTLKVFLSPELGEFGEFSVTTSGLTIDFREGLSGTFKLDWKESENSPATDAKLLSFEEGQLTLQRSRLIQLELCGKLDVQALLEDIETLPPGDRLRSNNIHLALGYDTETAQPTYELVLEATGDEAIWTYDRPNDDRPSDEALQLIDVVGALLILAPLLISSDANKTSTIVGLGAVTEFLKTRQIKLHGVQLKNLPNNAPRVPPALLLDYSVMFDLAIDLEVLALESTRPLSVRYHALGARLPALEPVFDRSQGFELDLADPGLFRINEALGDYFRVLGSRVVTLQDELALELDLGLKSNLGLFSVDSFRLHWPFGGKPSLTPSGIKLNIPNFIDGSGYLIIDDDLVSGGLDLTLVALKMRVYGAIKIEKKNEGNRHLTAVAVSFGADFPTPIPVLSTGIGIYGFTGLFAMHYERNEDLAITDPARRTLAWLANKSFSGKGERSATELTKWKPLPDNWALGVGVKLGLLSGREILAATGMFLLELPGPGLFFFVNISFLAGGDTSNLEGGVLGYVAFEPDRITVGMQTDVAYPPLIKLSLWATANFPLPNKKSNTSAKDWTLNLGTYENMISAKVLGVNVLGYLMVAGNGIDGLPIGKLTGLTIALGIRASVTLGSREIRLFFEGTGSHDMSLSVDTFGFGGGLNLSGTFMLFIVSLMVTTESNVYVSGGKAYIYIRAWAEIKFLVKKLKGTLILSLGTRTEDKALALVTAVQLQSRSPALLEGQGSDRPIDALLGEALKLGEAPTGLTAISPVPIDVIPIIRFRAPPVLPAGVPSFLKELTTYPWQTATDGLVDMGGGRKVRYELTKLSLTAKPTDLDQPEKPVTDVPWIYSPDKFGSETRGQDHALAYRLFTRDANETSRAVLLSQSVVDRAETAINYACAPIAPAAEVLWTFTRAPLGPVPAQGYWILTGRAEPDEPGTFRSTPPNITLEVSPTPVLSKCNFADEVDMDFSYPNDLIRLVWGGDNDIKLVPAEVIGEPPSQVAAAHSTGSDRVLRLPHMLRFDYHEVLEQAFACIVNDIGAVRLETGLVKTIRLLISGTAFSLRAYALDGALLGETGFGSVPWEGPFTLADGRVKDVFKDSLAFLEAENPEFYWVTWEPPESTAFVEVGCALDLEVEARTVLAAVALLRRGELDRQDQDSRAQQVAKSGLEDVLANVIPPLLDPNTTYTLSIGAKSSPAIAGDSNESYTFTTDSKTPTSLHPWVLATLPAPNTSFHFFAETPQLTLNDDAVFALFEKYGKKLIATLCTADGKEKYKTELTPGEATKLPACIMPPYEHALRRVIENSNGAACFETAPPPRHPHFALKAKIEANTSYILDIHAAEDDRRSGQPLLHIPFRTGEYKDAAALAQAVASATLRHWHLESTLTDVGVGLVTDRALEEALLAAGLPSLPPAAAPKIVLLWQGERDQESPVALLIDSPEPLWRERFEPEHLEVEQPSEDDWLQYWVKRKKPALEVRFDASPATGRIAHVLGGTRTLVRLETEIQGTLSLWEMPYAPLQCADKAVNPNLHRLLSLTDLPTTPPWRTNHD